MKMLIYDPIQTLLPSQDWIRVLKPFMSKSNLDGECGIILGSLFLCHSIEMEEQTVGTAVFDYNLKKMIMEFSYELRLPDQREIMVSGMKHFILFEIFQPLSIHFSFSTHHIY